MHFGEISQQQFLNEYWQKKPLLIKQALPDFISPITPDELAGLSLEEEFESRLITGSIHSKKWSLRNGVFSEQDFSNLPEQDWTLLVQGVDRHIDAVHNLITEFDFIPRWRFDDVMISYAATGGSVGPHFDYYDVFLLQGTGKRRWHLSTQDCELDNYLEDVPLRIMDKFNAEQVFVVEPGDVLYIPPKVAHHGVSLDDDCTTLSFGYRAYSAEELFEFVDKPCPGGLNTQYYQDPQWQNTEQPALIPENAIKQAQKLLTINGVQFAEFVTKLDPLEVQQMQNFEYDNQDEVFNHSACYQLHPVCKIAYLQTHSVQVFINGEAFEFEGVESQTLIDFCNQRRVNSLHQPKLAQQLFKRSLLLSI
ncbi:MAG: cupin domain-containing protein [Gammaproteobacteria bacterium]|nr:cupin domain-containing protein [Gammaproteobacteria bacterium]